MSKLREFIKRLGNESADGLIAHSAHGASEVAAALFTGQAFVMYGQQVPVYPDGMTPKDHAREGTEQPKRTRSRRA